MFTYWNDKKNQATTPLSNIAERKHLRKRSDGLQNRSNLLTMLAPTLTYCLRKNGDMSGGGLDGWGLSNDPPIPDASSCRY